MVTADVTACGRPRMPLGEQSGRCGGHAAARVCGGVRWRPGRVALRWAGSPASRGGRRADGRLLGSAPSTRRPVADRQHAEGPRRSAGDEPPASKGPLGDADRGHVEEAPKWSALANPARRAVVATGGVGEQDPRVDLSLDPRSAAPLCSGRCNAR